MGQLVGALSECYTYTVTPPTFLFCSIHNRPRSGERQALHPFLSRQIGLPPDLREILPVPSMPTAGGNEDCATSVSASLDLRGVRAPSSCEPHLRGKHGILSERSL